MPSRLDSLNEMLKEQPDDAFLLYAIALEEYKQLPEKGINLLQKLRQLQPDYLPLYYTLGKWLEENLNNSAAVEILNEGFELARKVNDKKTMREIRQALDELEDL